MLPWTTAGNDDRRAELARDLATGRLAHAYLFTGPTDIGKHRTAKEFAEAILAQGAADQSLIHKQVRTLSHPDLTVVDRLYVDGHDDDLVELAKYSNYNQEKRSHTPKAKSDTIRIDDMREVLRRVHQTREGWQVIVIRRIERMNREAANFFLKTLEEPPARTVFLMSSDQPDVILPTILSRCRVLQFSPVSDAAIADLLAEKYPQVSSADRERIVHLALGKPGRACRLAADPDIFTTYLAYFGRIKRLFEKPDMLARIQLAEEVSTSRAAADECLEVLTYFLRSFLRARAGKAAPDRYNAAKLAELVHKTHETRQLIGHNVNTRLAMEQLLFSI